MSDLIHCPHPQLCGVKRGHKPNSEDARQCASKGLLAQQAYGDKASVKGFAVRSATSSREDVDYNDPESYHGIYSDAREVESDDPTARAYEVTLEYGNDGELVVDGITRAKSMGGIPSTAEVLSQVAGEVSILDHLTDEASTAFDGGRAVKLREDMRTLLGDDYEQVMERAYAFDRASQPDALSDMLRFGAVEA